MTDKPNEASQPAGAVSGYRRQLDILARQLLAMRSGLEGLALQVDAMPAAKAAAHGLVDQLDTAFVIVGVLQATDDVARAAPTIETVPAPEGIERPKVFGEKRKTAAAAEKEPTTSPGEPKQ